MNIQELKRQVNRFLENREYDKIKPFLLSHKEMTEHDNDLAMTCYLCTIYEQEKAAGQDGLFSKIASMEELLERYTSLKFYLRRMDFDVMDDGTDGMDGMEAFYRFLSREQVSSYELLRVIDFSIVNKDKVLQMIKGGSAGEGSTGLQGQDKMGTADKTEPVKTEPEDGKTRDSRHSAMQEICFIICTHNQVYAKECIYYINHLLVPQDIRIDILTVEEAESLTAAYNEAMQYSRAKYKVYLHHDTFLINPDFIQDCLDIFRSNPQVGMIGNVGVRKMPDSGVMWDADRYGMLYEQHIYETELLANTFSSDLPYMEVEAIDGFIMVTQYDIPWREDLFTRWDFYDCSQSMEFRRHGYQVVVPDMRKPWCVHDCGFINLKEYDKEREKFVKEYMRNKDV